MKPETLPVVSNNPRLGVPYVGIGKFVAIGLNYSDHAKEAGMPIPTEPIVFMKATTCISGPNDDVIQPKNSTKLDWEVELGVVIGTKAQYVSDGQGARLRRRLLRGERRVRARIPAGDQPVGQGQGLRHLRADRPLAGHHRRDPDPQNLDMWLDVNGQRMQIGQHAHHDLQRGARSCRYVSQYMTLMPGDIITTGTPPGVGMGMKPDPVFLKPGDVMTLGIEGLGEQKQKVVAYPG